MNLLVKTLASGFFSGYLKPFPGTWGTIPAWLIGYFLIRGDQYILGAAILVTFVVGVITATQAEKALGKDASPIVIDEWAGMFVSLIAIPYSLEWYVVAFFAFRFYDIVKIPPGRQAERLPGGWGVMLDDIIAGIHTAITLQILIYLWAKLM